MQQYKTSLESYDAFMRLFRRFSRLCGADIMDDNFRVDYRTITLCSIIASYMVCVFYSVFHYYPNWLDVLEVFSLMGVGLQGAAKLYNCIDHSEQYRRRNRFLQKFLRIHSDHPKDNAVLMNVMTKIHVFKTILLLSYFFGMIMIGGFPLGYYLFYGQLKLAMNFLIPGVDPSSSLGFGITQAYHLVINVLTVVGIGAMDLIILVVVASVAGLVDVYRNKLEELDELLDLEDETGSQVRGMVAEIVELHQEIVRYETNLRDRYEMVNFVQLTSSVSFIALNLFLFYVYDYYHVIGFLLAGVFQLMEFCLLGTIFSVKNDEMTLAIYNTKWYQLARTEQRSLQLILARSQNSVELTALNLLPLNVETFVNIMKNIYKCFAMLITYMEPL
ncbi:odorant receptor 67d-like [Aedes aegypti]|uniref:Odorant receptor n=1 Tax=Aedes aegypti TaxID=7159 RepID=A0A6I8U2M9_AEDAE|nr:odorant receptor 133 [Aedes aegypti]